MKVQVFNELDGDLQLPKFTYKAKCSSKEIQSMVHKAALSQDQLFMPNGITLTPAAEAYADREKINRLPLLKDIVLYGIDERDAPEDKEVTQGGVQVPLEIFKTRQRKGWAVRCRETLPKGTFICEFAGEVLTNAQAEAVRRTPHEEDFLFDLSYFHERLKRSLADMEEVMGRRIDPVTLNGIMDRCQASLPPLCVDARESGNVGRFLTLSEDAPNCTPVPVASVLTHSTFYYKICFFSNQKVEKMTELTYSKASWAAGLPL